MLMGKIVYESPGYIRKNGVKLVMSGVFTLFGIVPENLNLDNLYVQDVMILVTLPKPHYRKCYKLVSGDYTIAIHQYKGKMIGVKALLEYWKKTSQ